MTTAFSRYSLFSAATLIVLVVLFGFGMRSVKATLPSLPPSRYYMTVEEGTPASILGESTLHAGAIDIDSWSFSVGTRSPHPSTCAASQGAGTFEELVISKKPDASTPYLFAACAKGTPIKNFSLAAPWSGGGERLKYSFNDGWCTSFKAASPEVGQLDEKLTLLFRSVRSDYTTQGASHTAADATLASCAQ